MKERIDIRGIVWFLVITFSLTFAVEFLLISKGVSPIVFGLGQYVVAAVMWVPGLAALVTVKFITKENLSVLKIRFGSWKGYASSMLFIPLCFICIYGLTYLFNMGEPDWGLNTLKKIFIDGGVEVPASPDPWITWIALYASTLFVAPVLNSVFGFGEELGWRGFLLPKLLPLGKVKAYAILGIIWGAWHFPLIWAGFMYPGHPYLGMVMFTLMTTVFGAYMNEMTLRYDSSVMAGWLHGVFNSQRLGIWTLLFPSVNPFFGGFSGVIGLLVWVLLLLFVIKQRKSN